MQPFDKTKTYVNLVCEQVRWKKAHTMIGDELENHIIDQKNAFMSEGLDEETATGKAICEMGDPVIVGTQFDRTHRPKTEWSMILLTIFMLSIGLAASLSIKSGLPNTPELFYFYRSAMAVIIGIIFMIIVYFIDFTIIGKHPKKTFILMTISMIVLLPFAMDVNGRKSWIIIPVLGAVSMSNFMLLLPTAYAGIIYSMRNKGYLGIILCGIFYAIPVFIFFTMSHGATSVLLCTLSCLILLTISIFKGWFNVKRLYGMLAVFVPTVAVSVMSLLITFSQSFRSARFEAFLNPAANPNGWGYIMIITRDILSGAKFFGQGTLPLHYADDVSAFLPPINIDSYLINPIDYMITYLIYRFGWISFFAVLSVLSAFIARGFYLCAKQKSVLGRLVSTSVLLTFTAQTVIYISANLGFQLFSQLTLPLISYGGASTIINLILVGIMLSVFKSGHLTHDNQKITGRGKNKIFEFVDGKIIIDLGLKQTNI